MNRKFYLNDKNTIDNEINKICKSIMIDIIQHSTDKIILKKIKTHAEKKTFYINIDYDFSLMNGEYHNDFNHYSIDLDIKIDGIFIINVLNGINKFFSTYITGHKNIECGFIENCIICGCFFSNKVCNCIYQKELEIKKYNSRTNGLCYFIKAGNDRVKIGYVEDESLSAINSRLNTIKTGIPFHNNEIAIIFYEKGGFRKEQELHKKFHHLRINKNREWFIFNNEIKEYINCKRNMINE